MAMSLYLFLGDPWQRRRAVDRLKRQLQAPNEAWREVALDGEEFEFSRFIEALQTDSLFGERTLVHLKRVEKLPEPEALLPHLERARSPDLCVIFEGEKLEGRGKLYKALKELGEVQEFTPPTRQELPKRVSELLGERGVRLPAQGLRALLEGVEGDLMRLDREIEKLACYAHGKKSLTLEELEGVIFHDRGGSVFAALEALLARRPEALKLLRAALEGGEEPTKVFYLLAAEVRALLRVKSLAAEGFSNAQIAQRTGDFPWRAAKRRRLAESLRCEELIELIHRLHEEDVAIKRGEREPEEALWALALAWLNRQFQS